MYNDGKVDLVEYNDPDWLTYFDQAKMHLVSGYPELWATWERLKKDGLSHLTAMKQLIVSLQSNLRESITGDVQLGQWAQHDFHHIDFKNLTWEVFDSMSRASSYTSGPVHIITEVRRFIGTSDPRQITRFNEIVERVANEQKTLDLMRELLRQGQRFRWRPLDDFKKRLQDRVDEFRQVGLPLLGECYRCKQINQIS